MGVHLILILVQVLMASLAIVGKLVLGEMSPGLLVMVRVVGAAAVLGVVHTILALPRVRSSDLPQFALLGLLGISANQTLFLLGLRHTTAINATILVTTIPVFTVLYSVLTRRESLSGLKLGGLILAGAGAVYLVGPDRISLAPDVALGNALIVLGMLCHAIYLVHSKRLLEHYRTVTVSYYVMLFGALGVLPFGLGALATMDLSAVSGRGWLLTGYIVLCPTILAYFLNIWALKRVSSNLVAVYIYLQPLFTVVTAPMILEGEHLTMRGLIAGLSIFAGVVLVIRAEQSQNRVVPVETMPGE